MFIIIKDGAICVYVVVGLRNRMLSFFTSEIAKVQASFISEPYSLEKVLSWETSERFSAVFTFSTK